MIYFCLIILGIAIGSAGVYLCLKKKFKQVREIDEAAVERNRKEWIEYNDLMLQKNQLEIVVDNKKKEIELLQVETDKQNLEINGLKQQKELIQSNIIDLRDQKQQEQINLEALKDQAEQSAEIFYKQSMQLTEEKLDRSLTQKGIEIQKACEDYEEDYAKLLEECVNEFVSKTVAYKKEYQEMEILLSDLRARVEAAVEANRREEEKETAKEFYRLNLTDEDLSEIAKLRSILPDLRNPEPLNKVIWKVYYEKPYTDLVGRVIGQGIKTGIYKITNIQNEKCYVGQAANIADRWRQHIKRGVGAEAPTRNKLYPAMLSIGVENFRFEVIEECDRSKLNEREDYWQDYFHAKDYGYSIK